MLEVTYCLAGIFIILQIGEYLWRHKILKGEYLRKFVHISSACFIAFWPWLISWTAIELIGAAMLAVVLYNHRSKALHMGGNIKRQTYGGMLFAVSVTVCAALTTNKVFFALAILHLGLADGLAAVAGTYFKKMRYKVFGQLKTVYGSMAFWLVSLCIFGAGSLLAYDVIPFNNFVWMLAILPPVLTIIESISIKGLDNLTVPVAVILALGFFS